MSNPYAKFGLRDEDVQGARAWQAYARKNGLSPSRTESALKWYGRNRDAIPKMSVDQIVASFAADTDHTWSDSEQMAAAAFHDEALNGDYSRFMPSEKEAGARLSELEKMVGDPSSEYYTGADSADLRAEYAALLEQKNSLSALTRQAATAAGASAADPTRLAELEAQIADANSPYYEQSGEGHALRSEYRQLLEGGPSLPPQEQQQQYDGAGADPMQTEGTSDV